MKILRKNFVYLTVPAPSCFFLLFSFIIYPASAMSSEPPIIAGKTKMTSSEQQVLSIMNYRTGNTYTWAIKSGGGSLSSNTGKQVTYTAPDSNPNCENNPTIVVDCNGESKGSISIAVSCYNGDAVAYREAYWFPETREWRSRCPSGFCHNDPCWWLCSHSVFTHDYRCDGSLQGNSGHCYSSCTFCVSSEAECIDECKAWISEWCSKVPPNIYDDRTDNMVKYGCCPEVLLPGYNPPPKIAKDTDHGKDESANKPICNPALVSNPISIYNGNNIETEEDLRLASPNHRQIAFKRFYNSQSDIMGPLGSGWTHTYSALLNPSYEFEGSAYLKITDETGRGVYFEDAGSGHYVGAFKERTTVEVEEGDYVWYRIDSDRFAFNAEGKLIWIEDKVGNRLNLGYDADNRLQTVTDVASSRILTFHYNADDLLDHISGPVTAAVADGIWVTYGYDTNKNLTSVTYADGSGFDYIYGDPNDLHNLTEKHDKMDHLVSAWTYDDQDRAIDNFTRDGQGVSINYVNENEVKVTDAYGVARTYSIWNIDGRKRVTDIKGPEGCPNCGSDVVRLEYDSAMHVIEVEYANGLINQYDDFDSRGNAKTVREAVGTPNKRTITYTFHPDIDAKLTQTEPSLIGAGNKVAIWDYDNDGDNIPNENPTRLLSRKIEQGFTKGISGNIVPFEYITTYTYNSKGQVLTIDGPEPGTQDTTIFTYDPVTGDLLSVNRPVVGTTTYSQYDASGQADRVTDINGNALVYAYDGRGRITATTNEADGSATAYVYNEAGDLMRLTDADGIDSDFTYDPNYGRLTRTIDPLGNYIGYTYDGQGNRTELSYFNSTDECVFWKRFNYHGPTRPGRLWKEINPDNTYTEYTYNPSGNISSVRDAADRTTTYDYDILNRLTAVTQPEDVITSYTYDSHDNLAGVTDAEGHGTTYYYDDLGRLVSFTSPDTNTTSYAYDAVGNLISKTDSNGNTVTYTYDALNRLTLIQFPDAAQDITYTYDTGTNGIGRLTGITDPSGTLAYAYDPKGQVVQETRAINEKVFTVGYTYSAGGRLTGITYPGGRTVSYGIDVAGRVMRVSSASEGEEKVMADNVAHLPFGPVSAMDLGNGIGVGKTFDLLYRLQTSQAGIVYNRSYAYDPVGNVAGIDDHFEPVRSQSFSYDVLNRLAGASGIYGSISYTYDQVGNRLTKIHDEATDTYSYMPGTNKLSEITGANPMTFAYDANGNTTSMGDEVFVYNQNNRLVEAAENGITAGEYVYNALGQRATKTANGQTTVFIYDQQGNLIAEADNDGEIVNAYIYLNGRLLAGVKSGIETIEAAIDIAPDTLNINSKGRWITCYIELAEGYDVADIDVATVVLEGSVYAESRPTKVADHDKDGIPDIMVKFNRSQVANLLETGDEVAITVEGEVSGVRFSGADTIRVIEKGKKGKKDKGKKWQHKKGKNKQDKKPKMDRSKKDQVATSPVNVSSESTQQTAGLYYYHLNHLGTPQLMTDEDGNVVWAADYRPFGEVDVTAESVGNEFRFPGQYYDQETGLHYNYHRYYHPTTGRYLTPDPSHSMQPAGSSIPYLLPFALASPQELTLYHYALNNPINAIDPLGLWFIDVGVSGAATGTLGPGGTIGFEISPSGLYWYYGVGLGVGGGFSATYNPFGDPSEGVNVKGTVRGGTGVVGAQAGGSLSEDGFSWTWGAGYGIGFGGAVTATQTIRVIDWSSIYNWFSNWFGNGDVSEEETCK
ncbi:MAG: RHS repeat protein [Desulfobacterales bacterium]|nr:RHS repeat protein [Desulfobacterales bacterium]